MRTESSAIYLTTRDLYDAINSLKMLRSEVEWFPRFIAICKYYHECWNEDDMDYEALKHVIECCECWREVWSFLMEYNETYFREQIQTWQALAKRCVTREREHREKLLQEDNRLAEKIASTIRFR